MKPERKNPENEKAVIFDLGNVLVKVDNKTAVRSFTDAVLSDNTDAVLEEILYQSSGGWKDKNSQSPLSVLHRSFHLGYLTAGEFFRSLQKHLAFNRDLSQEEFIRRWPRRHTLIDGSYRILKGLKGCKKYLLSDTNELDSLYIIERYPEIFTELDETFFSHQKNVLKYDSAAWKNIMAVSKLPPENHVFIDDIRENVVLAQNLGIKGIVFTGTEALASELAGLGYEMDMPDSGADK